MTITITLIGGPTALIEIDGVAPASPGAQAIQIPG